ncbi:SAM-dependent DNA methyltransferase [Clostridium sp. AF37-5]|uniref:Eco57I restriction-modification methylase domain-containing protein n=1 Tax=Clostridium sp. AF37-5 TaxID=2293016 RepID=UPI000E4E54ED|nr:N-6 DNA methylase [Clostridium sp. AF37-5]RHO96430.1 SAM-dependent DNA methyltransferase [Clostridium sp. AF37-5]
MVNRMDYIAIIKSDEYRRKLKKMAQDIKNASRVAPNEATIESRFDCELFAFFKEMFEPLGFIYNPIKEKSINTNTERHVSRGKSKGRADTAIASLVIEFKQPTTLSNPQNKAKAINQISEYLLGLSDEDNEIIEGYVTNGVEGCFVTLINGEIQKEDFLEINEFALDRIIQNILALKLIAFNASNLVDSFCNPPINDGVAYELVKCLYTVLIDNIKPKTKMLFIEWKQLFNLAHDDISKQQAIIDRKKSLENLLGYKFSDKDDEYLSLYALQTAYAIIVKSIAFKVVSQVRFNKSLISFGESINQDSEALRVQFSRLEEGAVFREYGITNLLEGDFFSWYCVENQWNESISECIKKIFEILSRYSDKAVLNNTHKSQDFFKRLYEAMVPAAVRHSLGEYYTRKWLAENVVEEAMSLTNTENWKGLDPCCGSGTFLNVMIDKILSEVKNLPKRMQLKEVLSRVKGVDLNPITVLTARVNYFLNISHLLEDNEPIDIPVYLGDSSYVPDIIEYDGIKCLDYVITTTKKNIEITVPKSIVDDTSKLAQEMIVVERQVKNLNVDRVFDTFRKLIKSSELTEKTEEKIFDLAENLVDLERNNWNGIWARILANYLSTANLGKFDIIVGNPPWVDWKSLPSGYRDRIKKLCISRHLFSGDKLTGGINLNICALIANVSAENWLKNEGVLGFLMPEPLVFQPSYEGFRNFYLNDGSRLYFCKFTNWTKAGHPFKPVTQKFLSFYLSSKEVNYIEGVPSDWYIKKRGKSIDGLEELDVNKYYDKERKYLATCNKNKNFFTTIERREDARIFLKIAGKATYIGREGIEFYPQELMVFELSSLPGTSECTCLRNMQNEKSKYKVPVTDTLLETKYLHPMIKGKDITPFHVEWNKYIVPFPYEAKNPRVPIEMNRLSVLAPKLAEYYNKHKKKILA